MLPWAGWEEGLSEEDFVINPFIATLKCYKEGLDIDGNNLIFILGRNLLERCFSQSLVNIFSLQGLWLGKSRIQDSLFWPVEE